MNSRLLWLRIAYWAGAIADARALVYMLFRPERFLPTADPAFRYAMAFGAALMAGWTVLLVWADRRPLERRGVLPITVCPVIVGLLASKLLVPNGNLADLYAPSAVAVPLSLSALFLFAYFYSRHTD